MVATVKLTLAAVGGVDATPKSQSFEVMKMDGMASESIACDTGVTTSQISSPAGNGIQTATAYVRVSDGDVWGAYDTGGAGNVKLGPSIGSSARFFQDDKLFVEIPAGVPMAFMDDTG